MGLQNGEKMVPNAGFQNTSISHTSSQGANTFSSELFLPLRPA